MMTSSKRFYGLARRRRIWLPTWRGWALLLLLGLVVSFVGVRLAYPFLAVTDPAPGGVLVVEGWAPDYTVAEAVSEFQRRHYDKLCVTGGPLERGSPLSSYRTYAELGAASAVKLGLSQSDVEAVPARAVRVDRTYASALALAKWLEQHGMKKPKVNIVTVGAHARRSRLLFELAMPEDASVGVIAVENEDFNSKGWWRSSQGVRTVTGEALAYAYARLLFLPFRSKPTDP
jgi:hypothetical protein